MCVRCTMLVTTPSPFVVHICWLFSNCNYFNVIDRKRCRLHMWVGCSLCLSTTNMWNDIWVPESEVLMNRLQQSEVTNMNENSETHKHKRREWILFDFYFNSNMTMRTLSQKRDLLLHVASKCRQSIYNPCYKCGSLHHLTIYTLELQNVAGIGYYCDMTNKHE